MFFDNTLVLSNAQAVSATAASTNVYDITGAATTTTATPQVFGTSTVFGADIGAGDGIARPSVFFLITTAIASTSINFQVQAAPDQGGTSGPGTYITLSETGVVNAAQLTAGTSFVLPIPPLPSGMALPRYYRVNYTVVGGSTGNVTAVILLNPPAGVPTKYPNNFSVAS